MANPNPLLQPPFYRIPGIDPNSPISAQTEQIDQLNTLLLRDIDANFAKFHQIVTTRILPEIKRFAIASEPTREAANFWRTFFEAAASTRVPTSDLSTDDTQQGTVIYHEDSLAEGSFFQDVVSSTPLPGRSAAAYDDSFSESMESPFDRLDRRLGGLHLGSEASTDMETPSLPSGYDLPGVSMSSVNIVPPSDTTPKALRTANPNISSGPSGNGIVDLRSTPLNAKFKGGLKVPGGRAPKLSIADLESLRDDDDDLKMTMSPPVTMTFNLPPRAAAIQSAKKSSKEPKGREANLILDDLMEQMSELDSPVAAAPEDLMRRYSVLPPQPSRRSMANTSYGSDIADIPAKIVYSNDDTFDQSNDSFDSPGGAGSHEVYTHDIDNSFDSDASPTAAKFRGHEPTETLFGGKSNVPGGFQVMGPDEIHTFHGGRLEDAWGQDTPTNPNKR